MALKVGVTMEMWVSWMVCGEIWISFGVVFIKCCVDRPLFFFFEKRVWYTYIKNSAQRATAV